MFFLKQERTKEQFRLRRQTQRNREVFPSTRWRWGCDMGSQRCSFLRKKEPKSDSACVGRRSGTGKFSRAPDGAGVMTQAPNIDGVSILLIRYDCIRLSVQEYLCHRRNHPPASPVGNPSSVLRLPGVLASNHLYRNISVTGGTIPRHRLWATWRQSFACPECLHQTICTGISL